ncbi:MAG TPA: hypothetical protein DEQ43_26625 [Nocardioides bacterium]|mgnify:FL=1|jgi:hypothetical protein|uniref:hypothetical protein n=1 Tax=uncultured Nocardioides sp. TaxID=198441 RepID=UPI000ED5D6E8|nr:hypothetical protein [uncultured Nocardioides sp.]MCB0908717.1 hypothetical protein [Nocardioidaceae bacterium]HCB07786.1 hypothetical protein [Nocardioides sp.]
MTTGTAPRYSTRELQAAAEALAGGRFSKPTSRDTRRDTAPAGAASVVSGRGAGSTVVEDHVEDAALPVEPESTGTAPLVRVRASSAGAGASTITLALADVADGAGIRTRVLDAAAPTWSGLLGATVTELGAAEGWRRGRRGDGVLIDRVEGPVHVPSEVPGPRSADGVDLTVLDAGWSTRELMAPAAGCWVATTPACVEVLVTRPHSLALSQTESALAGLEAPLGAGQVVVVVVGAGRWSERGFATAGRLLRAAHEQEAVLFAPLLPAKALPGLGPDPLPKQLTNPSQRLLERITTITGPLTANRT